MHGALSRLLFPPPSERSVCMWYSPPLPIPRRAGGGRGGTSGAAPPPPRRNAQGGARDRPVLLHRTPSHSFAAASGGVLPHTEGGEGHWVGRTNVWCGACGDSICTPHVPRPIPGLPALSPPHPLVLCMPPCLLPCPRPPPNAAPPNGLGTPPPLRALLEGRGGCPPPKFCLQLYPKARPQPQYHPHPLFQPPVTAPPPPNRFYSAPQPLRNRSEFAPRAPSPSSNPLPPPPPVRRSIPPPRGGGGLSIKGRSHRTARRPPPVRHCAAAPALGGAARARAAVHTRSPCSM